MLNKKIIIYPTIEVDEYSEITRRFNSDPVKNCVFICMESMPSIKDSIISNIIGNKDYSPIFKTNMSRWNLNDAMEEFLSMKNPEKVLNDVFNGTYDKLLKTITYNLENTSGQHDLLFAMPFSYPKPTDYFTIGWIVPESDGEHLNDHEKVSEHVAHRFIEKYNDYLRSNSMFFDKFFDGNSMEEVLDFIKNLE